MNKKKTNVQMTGYWEELEPPRFVIRWSNNTTSYFVIDNNKIKVSEGVYTSVQDFRVWLAKHVQK